VILSDIDEIIDERQKDRIIEETRKRGIITIKIYFTLFYFNLFSRNIGGPPDYSYRIFIMTGKYFNKLKMTSDQLRKAGEHGKLMNEVYCLEEFMGFHHSWIGDANFIKNKLLAYAHIEFRSLANEDYIQKCIKEKKSIYPGHELYIDHNIEMLRSVMNQDPKDISKYLLTN
jgi:hypothetical protein